MRVADLGGRGAQAARWRSARQPDRAASGTPMIAAPRDVDAGLAEHAERRAEQHAAERRAQARAAGTRGRQRGRRPTRRAASRPGSLAIRAKSTLPTSRCGEAGGPQHERGVEDVGPDDAVRRQAEDDDQRRARSSAPEPTEVMPEHEAEDEADAAPAPTLCRARERTAVALARDARTARGRGPRTPTMQQRRRDDRQQRRVEAVAVAVVQRVDEQARRRSRPGTEPTASHFETPRSTVPGAGGASRRRVLVIAP